MSVTPLITIGIPTWNRARHLKCAIESALAQSYTHIEVLVSDNCSTDHTAEAVSAFADPRIRYIRQSHNVGASGNYDAVLRAAAGELFFMLPDDDFLAPAAMEELSGPFRQPMHGAVPADVGVSWCPCINVDADGKHLWQVHSGPPNESSLAMMLGFFDGTRGPQFCSVMMRTADGILAGGFDDHRFGVLSDSVPWSKTALRYPNVICIDQPLVYYTVHDGLTSTAASCAEWQRFANNQVDDFAALRESMGDAHAARLIRGRRNHLLANITVSVLMRFKGQPGWINVFAKEFWRSRRFMLTFFVLRRTLRDGWKLLRLKRT